MTTETVERKSNAHNLSEVCPCCDGENVKRMGGISADYTIQHRTFACDVSNYKCWDCGEEWSD